MNIFYAPPEQISANSLRLVGQEARHAAKTLRYSRGDEITVIDGEGGWYKGQISQITDEKVWIDIISKKQKDLQRPRIALGIGLIKKRDRLEFAVEKAVELGAAEIIVFRAGHSVKQNVREDRLEAQVLSAVKQSLRAWLPKVNVFNSLDEAVEYYHGHELFVAHHSGNALNKEGHHLTEEYLLLVGPEGDFTRKELDLLQEKEATFIGLGEYRLRTETAAIVLLNKFLSK